MSSVTPSPFSRPAYPHLQSSTSTSSTSSSAFQSSSSLSSLTMPTSSAAPMPSPSAQQSQQQPFFGSIRPQQQQPPPYSESQQPQQQQFGASQASFDYRPNREGAGRTNGETKNLLSEYALIAEAAKRAQMAVLMRDMEGVEL